MRWSNGIIFKFHSLLTILWLTDFNIILNWIISKQSKSSGRNKFLVIFFFRFLTLDNNKSWSRKWRLIHEIWSSGRFLECLSVEKDVLKRCLYFKWVTQSNNIWKTAKDIYREVLHENTRNDAINWYLEYQYRLIPTRNCPDFDQITYIRWSGPTKT